MSTAIRVQVKHEVDSGLRPVNPLRDLLEIVDLIELGFQDELDPQGLKMLKQMRRFARQRMWPSIFHSNVLDPQGVVWIEDGHVVGNLSIRRAAFSQYSGWLIGNVVVHPDYRGQHIGRALMDYAIEWVLDHQGHWVGLEVREDNKVARNLYESLGFELVGTTLHMLRPGGLRWDRPTEDATSWRSSRPEDNKLWARLAKVCYDLRQQDVLEIRPGLYSFGSWSRKLDRWLNGQNEWAWVKVRGQTGARAGVCVRLDRRYRFYQWGLLLHPQEGELGALESISQAISVTRRARLPVITIVPAHPELVTALKTIGFGVHRSLAQMLLHLE
ncbi:MAG: GNAT family N-acetyltransferase [Anaerolineae bacterium]|nr:GNAT family N-acetyltransferase [Anaerolineae bacterium]